MAAAPSGAINGLTIQLDTLPINFDGRIVLTEPKADDAG